MTKLNSSQTKKVKGFETKSAQIRYLDSIGCTRSEISTYLTKLYGKLVRYQHVRNVLITPVKQPK